jgi:hypothetical protein
MSVGLKSFPEEVKKQIAHKREQSGTGGLGYWGARDALKKIGAEKAK